MMRYPAVAFAAAALIAGAVATSPTAAISEDAVLVFRGAAVEAVNLGAAALGASSGVDVVRGNPVQPPKPPPPYPFRIAKALSPEIEILGGDRVWFVDRLGDRLTACNLRNTTQVGRRAIRCRTRRIPNTVEGF